MFVERETNPNSILDQVLVRLYELSTLRLEDHDVLMFREMASAWITFNFRPLVGTARATSNALKRKSKGGEPKS